MNYFSISSMEKMLAAFHFISLLFGNFALHTFKMKIDFK